MRQLYLPGKSLAVVWWATSLLMGSHSSAEWVPVRINEFVAINATGLEDKDGDRTDWVELYHGGHEFISLRGWFLTDDLDDLRKWSFPNHSGIAGQGYAIVFASGKDDNSIFSNHAHTSFSLSGKGGFLALVRPDGEIADEVEDYPPQRSDVAYGLIGDTGEMGFLAENTPKAPNSGVAQGSVGDIQFSVTRGVFSEPVTLELSTETPGARILFSRNGALPGLFTAVPYVSAIEIGKTTIIRAVASKQGLQTSAVATHTYIFPEDVVDQRTMNRRVTDVDAQRRLLIEGLADFDSLSIARHKRTEQMSASREETASIELVKVDGSEGFQIDAGIKRVGGASLNHPKNNMRLFFSGDHGPSKLKYPLYEGHPYAHEAADEFDRLQLHGGSHDSSFYNAAQALYLRNPWMNDAQFAMGQPSLRGRWLHVYIDGIYWGIYHLIERPHPTYFASYLGGDEDDYMATNRGQPVGSSDMKPWREMTSTVNDYAEFQRRVDVTNFVDYMLLNLYAGNQDWNASHNWMAGGPVTPDRGGFKFFSWDSDLTLRQPSVNLISSPGPENLFSRLKRHDDFKVLLADRIYRHLYHDGPLTAERSLERFHYRASEIERAIVAESARWGVGNWGQANWKRELKRLTDSFFPKRTELVIEQFKKAKLFNALITPSFSPSGGPVPHGQVLALRKSLFATADIYYTTDGSDPRAPGGAVSPTASRYTGPLTLTQTQSIRMRSRNAFDQDLPWSAIVEAEFLVGSLPATSENLVISKIDYRPAEPNATETQAGFVSRSDFEFIELANVSEETVYLRRLAFVDGVRFDFGDEDAASISELGPRQSLLLVRNGDAFAMRYGQGMPIAGVFQGGLSNGGERLRLEDDRGRIVSELTYDDRAPWPEAADGSGPYLVYRSQLDGAGTNDPAHWRPSTADDRPGAGGLPHDPSVLAEWRRLHFGRGEDDGDDLADPDGDGRANLLEFVFGSDPKWAESTSPLLVSANRSEVTYQFLQRQDVRDEVSVELEFSDDLVHWEGAVSLTELPRGEGPAPGLIVRSLREVFHPTEPRRRFVRLRATRD